MYPRRCILAKKLNFLLQIFYVLSKKIIFLSFQAISFKKLSISSKIQFSIIFWKDLCIFLHLVEQRVYNLCWNTWTKQIFCKFVSEIYFFKCIIFHFKKYHFLWKLSQSFTAVTSKWQLKMALLNYFFLNIKLWKNFRNFLPYSQGLPFKELIVQEIFVSKIKALNTIRFVLLYC